MSSPLSPPATVGCIVRISTAAAAAANAAPTVPPNRSSSSSAALHSQSGAAAGAEAAALASSPSPVALALVSRLPPISTFLPRLPRSAPGKIFWSNFREQAPVP